MWIRRPSETLSTSWNCKMLLLTSRECPTSEIDALDLLHLVREHLGRQWGVGASRPAQPTPNVDCLSGRFRARVCCFSATVGAPQRRQVLLRIDPRAERAEEHGRSRGPLANDQKQARPRLAKSSAPMKPELFAFRPPAKSLCTGSPFVFRRRSGGRSNSLPGSPWLDVSRASRGGSPQFRSAIRWVNPACATAQPPPTEAARVSPIFGSGP
jgi:hypothetical protein